MRNIFYLNWFETFYNIMLQIQIVYLLVLELSRKLKTNKFLEMIIKLA